MARPKKIVEASEEIKQEIVDVSTEKTEKEILLDLYEVLKSRNIRSISDLENQIANCR